MKKCALFLIPQNSTPFNHQKLAGDRSWWKVYEESFPSCEQEPNEIILKSLRCGVGLSFRLRSQGCTVGIATTHLLLQPPAVFLVYLAIDRDHRQQGLGRPLLEYACSTSAARLGELGLEPLGMIWEADTINDTQSVKAEDRVRRVRFFERLGAFLLPNLYLQPPVDGIAPVRMQLMYRPAKGRQFPSNSTVTALIRAIYFEKYGAVNHIPVETLNQLLVHIGCSASDRQTSCNPVIGVRSPGLYG